MFSSASFMTGALIFLVMLFMYSAADPFVRKGHSRLFWNTHFLFPIFYILLFIHGWSYEFLWYFAFPLLMYTSEWTYRKKMKTRSMKIISITNLKNSTMAIEFAKSGAFVDVNGNNDYREGQYLFLNCPSIDSNQWMPFTITSAPSQPTVSIHVRILGEESWTSHLQQYLKSIGQNSLEFRPQLENSELV